MHFGMDAVHAKIRNDHFRLLFRYQMAARKDLPLEGRLRLRPPAGQHVPEFRASIGSNGAANIATAFSEEGMSLFRSTVVALALGATFVTPSLAQKQYDTGASARLGTQVNGQYGVILS